MATTAQITNFINTIGPLVQKYAKQYGYHVASPIIAQACCESGYGTSSLAYKYHNYFGMKCGRSWKGKSVNMATKEEYTPGTLTNISANFRVYDSIEEGVKGYLEFISYSRYANLKSATTPKPYLELIKQDGYATSSTYVDTNYRIVTGYNLTRFDNFGVSNTPEVPKKSNEEIAKEILDGKWGNGAERKRRLIQAGYDYSVVQDIVNKMCSTNIQKPETIFHEGDKIKLSSNATYWNGKKIPSWVFKSTLYYRGTNDNGVIFSTQKTGAITGVVNKKFISKI